MPQDERGVRVLGISTVAACAHPEAAEAEAVRLLGTGRYAPAEAMREAVRTHGQMRPERDVLVSGEVDGTKGA